MTRGRLRVYLGAAPGVGKTYAMLGEARRRVDRGTDVVVGFVETHGRRHTAEMLGGLEVVPRRTVPYRGTSLEEMDVDAVLRRRPQVALVDELAHTNAPGTRNEKRWQDVEELLEAGIDVITTVNVQHLESLNDVVEKITGVAQRETVPDAVVRAADQVELVDMSAEALRRRLAHGNVYAPDKVDAALSNYFRAGNLTALRELALLWVADRVDDALQHYRQQHDISGTWEARERVVVALSGGPEGEHLIRRAARIAARSGAGDLLALHISRSDGLTGADPAYLNAQRQLVESLGGSFHQVLGDDVSEALLVFARAENATQLVLGDSRRPRWQTVFSGTGIGSQTIRRSGDIDVHIVTHAHVGRGRLLPESRGSLSGTRRARGYLLAVVLPLVLTGILTLVDDAFQLNFASDMMLFLIIVVGVALVGGLGPALVAALLGSMLLNYFFTPPLYTLTIQSRNNALALFVYVLVGLMVSSVVDVAARRTREAARAVAESHVLANLAATPVTGRQALDDMLERFRETFSLDSVALLEEDDDGARRLVGSAGPSPASTPELADQIVPATDTAVLALRGQPLTDSDQRIALVFAARTGQAVEQIRLAKAAAEAAPLAEANRVRTALLAAVGHDLRTPLATAKAVVSGLRSPDVELAPEDRAELLETADAALDRLAGLVDNLLDMSRLQVGAMPVHLRPVAVEEVLTRALDDLGVSPRSVMLELADALPAVVVDPGLLERVIVNLVSNAQRYSPAGSPPLISGSSVPGRLELRVVDTGPGIPPRELENVFLPFQRLGDTDTSTGVGLGLAVSRGLVEAMGGTLEPEETPGGGLTMVVSLPTIDEPALEAVPDPVLEMVQVAEEGEA
ncbi:sensor histidine kinase KdpD [Nocardioides panacihumi]|uniref:histidine kinase n=1 Tax=Nocardioides panacihumi TaxID=400774 RepID=A0ABP5BPN2_9ACTN